MLPELAYDSYITIGAEDATSGTAEHPSSIWGEIDVTLEFDGDGPGNSILVDDSLGGAWYTVFPGLEEIDTHAGFAGDDLRVLLAQLTTAGTLSGQIKSKSFKMAFKRRFRELLHILTDLVRDAWTPTPPITIPKPTSQTVPLAFTPVVPAPSTVPSSGTCELAAWQRLATPKPRPLPP